jgi:hypothetical protein
MGHIQSGSSHAAPIAIPRGPRPRLRCCHRDTSGDRAYVGEVNHSHLKQALDPASRPTSCFCEHGFRTLSDVSEPIVSIDTSEIREGKLDDLKVAVGELVAFVESNEPRPILYDIFFDETGTLMTVVQMHPDSESMEYHMTVAGPAFAGFSELVTLSTLDVYGEPSEALLEQLGRKVQLLGPATVVVHDLQAGFARLDPR